MDPTLAKSRIESADKLWRSLLKIKGISSSSIGLLLLLDQSEYQRIVTEARFRVGVIEANDAINAYITTPSVLDEVRPFVGEELFTAAFSYRTFHARIVIMLAAGIEQGHIPLWYDDQIVKGHLQAMLSPDELRGFEEAEPFRKLEFASELLESKVVARIREIFPT